MHSSAQRVPAWLAASMATLALRRGERVLVCDDLPANAAAQLARSVGSTGIVVVAVRRPRVDLHEVAGATRNLRVVDVHLTAASRHDLGRFDACLAAPTLACAEPAARFAGVARHGLRLGGRLVLDLPGPGVNDDLHRCLAESGHARCVEAGTLAGYAVDAVREALESAGLRDVAAHLLASMETLDDAAALVEMAAAVGDASVDLAAVHIVASAILAGRAEPVQSVWRRVRAAARR